MTDQPKYAERESLPEEEDRGRVLDALAAGNLWLFLQVDVTAPGGMSLKLEQDDRLDVESLRALLNRMLELLP